MFGFTSNFLQKGKTCQQHMTKGTSFVKLKKIGQIFAKIVVRQDIRENRFFPNIMRDYIFSLFLFKAHMHSYASPDIHSAKASVG
jgi:hypothetical protein